MDPGASAAAFVHQVETIARENPDAATALAEALRQILGPFTVTASSNADDDQALRTDVKAQLRSMAQDIRELKQTTASLKASSNARPSGSTVPALPSEPPTSARPDMGQPFRPVARAELPSRNLVVCIDGTSNQFSLKNTNVVELYSRLIRDETQLTFYISGIGTFATPSWKSWKYIKQFFGNKIDLAIAWRFQPILLSAYRWLSENYRKGDKIYLFGFSRGAYQIRTLAAMIDSVGLLRKGNIDQIPFAYELYAETKPIKNVNMNAMRKHYKTTFSEKDVKVYFAGAWDTVSSVGLFRTKALPGTNEGMTCVTFFRHALALHERRVKFLQENVNGGSGPDEIQTQEKDGQPPHTKEVWFAGSHGNVGGGVKINVDLNLFGPALRWMLFEAAVAGLRLTDAPQKWDDQPVTKINNSLTGIWHLLEHIPIKRLTYDANGLTSWPHCGRVRQIQNHQLIHATALESPERWRARLPAGMVWNRIDGLVEKDPYGQAKSSIEVIRGHLKSSPTQTLPESDVNTLKILVWTEPGRRSLRDTPPAEDVLMAAMGRYAEASSDAALRHAEQVVADAALAALNVEAADDDKYDKYYSTTQLRPIIARARKKGELELAARIEYLFAPAQVQRPLKHPDTVLCVAYMPGGDRVVSGCEDGAVRVWDLKSGGVVGAEMTGHTELVCSVAVWADGTQIASGSADRTIRLWSVESGATRAILRGHDGEVNSVAFSPDGLRVVSGSDDRTIRVWDVKSAKTIVGPITGHTAQVRSVAYSPDGSQIVSVSVDQAVRVWSAETGVELWQAETTLHVLSVAYSPDGKRIVAGCSDWSVRVLDAEAGSIVLGPLTGHTHSVHSVAFSRDGKIASGSDDGTVRLWDAETGAELDVLRGHRGPVYSVAFLLDGKQVASASRDGTVRVWDATGAWKTW